VRISASARRRRSNTIRVGAVELITDFPLRNILPNSGFVEFVFDFGTLL